jgi:hypothetical protein
MDTTDELPRMTAVKKLAQSCHRRYERHFTISRLSPSPGEKSWAYRQNTDVTGGDEQCIDGSAEHLDDISTVYYDKLEKCEYYSIPFY